MARFSRKCELPTCAKPFETDSHRAKYCSDSCRNKAWKRSPKGLASSPSNADNDTPCIGLSTVTLRDLEKADVLETAEGRRALALAAKLDTANSETAAGFVALIREHRESLNAAVALATTTAGDADDDDDADLYGGDEPSSGQRSAWTPHVVTGGAS